MIIGNTVAFETSSNHAPNYLLGSPIVVPAESTIDAFGVIARKKAREKFTSYTGQRFNYWLVTE